MALEMVCACGAEVVSLRTILGATNEQGEEGQVQRLGRWRVALAYLIPSGSHACAPGWTPMGRGRHGIARQSFEHDPFSAAILGSQW
jgi:hypothetical protein